MPKCPKCGAELLEVGYPDELGFQRYRCPNNCKFETPLSWKIHNAVAIFILFIAYLFMIPIAVFVRFIIAVVDFARSVKRWYHGRGSFVGAKK